MLKIAYKGAASGVDVENFMPQTFGFAAQRLKKAHLHKFHFKVLHLLVYSFCRGPEPPRKFAPSVKGVLRASYFKGSRENWVMQSCRLVKGSKAVFNPAHLRKFT
ncbi:hypothetical protein AL09_00725 [Corynebacterium diphtheriae bv. gravis str. ISS 4749]|nr:hypothetical protein AL09_00725 [Corynebacterium diphtheriae bv. gravis str. ISS 4749]